MTNAALRGKPDAGNPHVRFDEGEVASAKPRRGSLLYNEKIESVRTVATHLRRLALAIAGVTVAGVCGADVLTLAESTTWTDLSALEGYDGVEIAASKTLTLKPASGTLVLNKPISGAGGVLKDGAGHLEIRADNTFTGAFVIGGTGNVYAYANGAFGSSSGRTTLYEYSYTGGVKDTSKAGANLYLCGITTDEGFDLISNGGTYYLYSQTNTANTINGSVTLSGTQTSIYALQGSTLRLRGGVTPVAGTGAQFRPSAQTDAAIIIENKPLTCGMWNANVGSGKLILNAPNNACGYTFLPIQLGCDWAFNGAEPSWGTGSTHMKIDLNGYANRMYIGCSKDSMNGWLTSTRGKAFVYFANTKDVTSYVPFRGQAGLFHEGAFKTTFKRTSVASNASDTTGELCVTNGTVAFDTGAAWPNVSCVTLSGKGKLELCEAGQIGTKAILTISGSGLLTAPADGELTVQALCIDGVWKEAGAYSAAQLNGHLADNDATVRVTCKPLPGYALVSSDTVWGDAELAALSECKGVMVFAPATLTLSNSVPYALKKPLAGTGTVALEGSARFDLDAASPDFDGTLDIGGFSSRTVNVNCDGAFGSTVGATTVHLLHKDTASVNGTQISFNGITTAENITFRGKDSGCRIYAAVGTVNTFNGDIQAGNGTTDNQVSFYAQANSSFVFNKSFAGGSVAPSPGEGASIVFNCPCTSSFFNSHQTTGKLVFNATGNKPLGYFGCQATFGVDYALDNVGVSFGMYYNANPWFDLNGHDQRLSGISSYRDIRSIKSCSYATDTTGKKSFLHVNSTATSDSRVYFKGTAGFWWEGNGTITFKETTSTSRGDLIVAAGRVIFDTAVWRSGDIATVKSGAVLEIKNADNFAFHHLVVEDGGKVVMAEGTLCACDVTLGSTTYPAGSTLPFSEHASYFEGNGTVTCSGDYIIDVPAANADTVVTNTVDVPATALRIVKRGAGTAYAKLGSNASSGAEVVIEAGVLGVATADDIPALLKTGTSAITVKSGGTFDMGCLTWKNAASILNAASVTIEGEGAAKADGTTLGAIRRIKRAGDEDNSNSHQLFSSLRLSGDATVYVQGLDCGCGCANGGRRVLDGHTFTKTGPAQWYWSGETTPGNFVVENGTFILWGDPTLEGGATNTVRVNGGVLMFNNCSAAMKPVPHTLVWDGGDKARLSVYNMKGKWGGPCQANSDLYLQTAAMSPNNGALTMTNSLVSTNALVIVTHTHPTVTLTGAHKHKLGDFQISGALELRDGAEAELVAPASGAKREIALAQSTADSVRAYGYPAQMTISNATFTSAIAKTPPANVYGDFVLSWSANNGAELNIHAGSVVTGLLLCAQGGFGAVHQTGGEFVARDVSGRNIYNTIGSDDTAYGAYMLSGGRFVSASGLTAAMRSGCTSIVRQDGGTFVSGVDGHESFDTRSGYLSLYQSGGVFTNASAISFGAYTSASTGDGGRFEITVKGPNTKQYHYWDMRVSGNHLFVDSTVMHVADGGMLDFRHIPFVRPTGSEGKRFYFGSDGGVLKPHASGAIFNGEQPDRATVYGSGLVIDTSDAGGDVTLAAALKKPTGKVVTGITLPAAALSAAGYLGPAKVVVSGGNGAATTAVTDYDANTHKITGTRIASPGFGYADGDDVTATVEGPFKNTSFDCAVTLGNPDLTGGLTKRGSNMLTLTGANDYAGVTRIEGGTLAFGQGAYPADSDVVITAEAAMEAYLTGTPALIAVNFPAGRTITVMGVDSIPLDALKKAIRLVRFDGTQPANVTLRALDADGKDHKFTDGNGLYYANGKISLGKPRGSLLILR